MTTLLAIVYCVLESFNLKAYLYQHTIHKFAVSHGMSAERESKLYPPKYRYYTLIGKINWIVLGFLLYDSWTTGLMLLALSWILGIILPANHVKHFKELSDYLNSTGLRIEFMDEYCDMFDIIREAEGRNSM